MGDVLPITYKLCWISNGDIEHLARKVIFVDNNSKAEH